MKDLLAIPMKDLLSKFGEGSHKPGSGSAAALQGILSAQLLVTVIDLTRVRNNNGLYDHVLDEFDFYKNEIIERIIPELENWFQVDSEKFDKVITARSLRDQEKDSWRKKGYAEEALKELQECTEIPIEISKLGLELAEYSCNVFNEGFKSARGDSAVSLFGSLATVSGCISIIDLNLLSFQNQEWTQSISEKLALIRQKHSKIFTEAQSSQEKLREEEVHNQELYKELDIIRNRISRIESYSDFNIESIARDLQNLLWTYRSAIWKGRTPENHIEALKPSKGLNILGYGYNKKQSLGYEDVAVKPFEVAGLIDNEARIVEVSQQFSPEIMNFTSAHELGHALFHSNVNTLHRDRPKDVAEIGARDLIEKQADRFATFFLMPKKIVKSEFKRVYGMDQFVLNENTAFALTGESPSVIREKCRDLRGFSRLIAKTEFFNNIPFKSIASRFEVSIEAMAIRLEELDLLRF